MEQQQMSSEYIPDQTKEIKVIPKDLQDQFSAVKACATALSLFDLGSFSPRHLEHIPSTMAFLSKLYEQTLDQALKHEQAHMIPELKQAMEQKNGQAKAN